MSEKDEQEKKQRVALRDSIILNKLCDMTGSDDGSYKGFALFYVDHEGFPQTLMRVENPAIQMVLNQMLYNYVEAQEAAKDNPNN